MNFYTTVDALKLSITIAQNPSKDRSNQWVARFIGIINKQTTTSLDTNAGVKYAVNSSWWPTSGRTAVACSQAIFCIRLKEIYPRLLKDVIKILVTFFLEKRTTLINYVSD